MHTNRAVIQLLLLSSVCIIAMSHPAQASDALERDFRNPPMSARRHIGPLLWLHGDESKDCIEQFVEKIAQSGNGTFTVESRPHSDWLGPGWWRDLKICLEAAKKHGLTMWIFDEKWYPSGMVAGKVPERYSSKVMVASEMSVPGQSTFADTGYGTNLIAAIAGRQTPEGIDPDSLINLSGSISGDKLTWNAPGGDWKVMKFTWQNKPGLVDGASQDCVDWYIRTVYQPHYDHFKADFGKTIKGFFYDEPQFPGDWGTEVIPMLKERGIDWMKALVAYKFSLSGEDQTTYKYQYHDAYAETWGRTFYGGLQDWCRKRGVDSMGHFVEHHWQSLSMNYAAGDMFKLGKYSAMGGLDLVHRQLLPGWRSGMGPEIDSWLVYQTPKLGSSIAHVYGMKDDITMCEMFGAYGQEVTYPQTKWLTDQMYVRGVNYTVTHSFNPRGPYDNDSPPFFYMGEFEPRWPLYRVFADYTSRMGSILSGGRHVCPVALLWVGVSSQVGTYVVPEDMTTAIQDSLYDCDWLPYDVLENGVRIKDRELKLHGESYRVLVVPPVEAIPYGALARVKEFFDKGGVVIGYGFLPSKSATAGKTSEDIARLAGEIWGEATPCLGVCRVSPAGGRSYFLPEKPSPEDLQKTLAGDANVPPVVEVVKGDTNHWLHVLHRVKDGRDIFLVCNQNWQDQPRQFTLRLRAPGYPECWDAMRNEIAAVPFRRTGDAVDLDITLQPAESVLIVMQPKKRNLPARLDDPMKPLRTIAVEPTSSSDATAAPREISPLNRCSLIWCSKRFRLITAFFRGHLNIPEGRKVSSAEFLFNCNDKFALFLNGKPIGDSEGHEVWRGPVKVDVGSLLVAGDNIFAMEAQNQGVVAKRIALVGRCQVELDNGEKIDFPLDASALWKTTDKRAEGWLDRDFDDSAWVSPVEVGKLGSPVTDATFTGTCVVPDDLDLRGSRIYIEADAIGPEAAASVTVNGDYAGGFIEGPLRLDITSLLRKGENSIRVAPFAPERLRITIYGK